MTAESFFDRPGVRRATRFALVIIGAGFLLWALAVRARSGGRGAGPGAGADEVRWIAAAACAVAALIAPRVASRAEAIGFFVAALALAARIGADHLGSWAFRRISVLGAEQENEERLLLLHAGWSLVVLGGPLVVGAWLLKTPAPDLLRPPGPAWKPMLLALAAGFALYPVLAVATTAVNALVDGWVGSHAKPWPGWNGALHAEVIDADVARKFRWIALALAIELPLLEILLHGVLRQALSRWGVVGFVVGTAVLAPVVMISGTMSFFLFGGCIVTGLFAARTASIVPGFAFWTSLVYGWIAWGWILPAR